MAQSICIKSKSNGTIVAAQTKIANNTWTRIWGLIGTKELPPNTGLWLIPCNSIHMFGMRYAIDAIYLDKKNVVLKIVANLKPGQLGPIVWKAHSVLELPAGTCEKHKIKVGDFLESNPS